MTSRPRVRRKQNADRIPDSIGLKAEGVPPVHLRIGAPENDDAVSRTTVSRPMTVNFFYPAYRVLAGYSNSYLPGIEDYDCHGSEDEEA